MNFCEDCEGKMLSTSPRATVQEVLREPAKPSTNPQQTGWHEPQRPPRSSGSGNPHSSDLLHLIAYPLRFALIFSVVSVAASVACHDLAIAARRSCHCCCSCNMRACRCSVSLFCNSWLVFVILVIRCSVLVFCCSCSQQLVSRSLFPCGLPLAVIGSGRLPWGRGLATQISRPSPNAPEQNPKMSHDYIHFFPRLTLVATVVRTQSLFLSHLASMVFNLPCSAG